MADLIEFNATAVVQEIERVRRKLDAMPDKLQKKVLRPATRAAGKVVLDRVKSNTPVDTGELRKSWRLRALRRSRKFKDRVGVRVYTGVRGATRTFSGETFYGSFLEFGAPGAGIPPLGFVARSAKEAVPGATSAFLQALRAKLLEVTK